MEQANNSARHLQLLERYSSYPEVYCRGQSAKHRSITSSITRDKGYLINEYHINTESIRMKQDEFKYLTYPIERLSKLQHYGICLLHNINGQRGCGHFFGLAHTANPILRL
jgi:Zn/Cd-binding protein ZinT